MASRIPAQAPVPQTPAQAPAARRGWVLPTAVGAIGFGVVFTGSWIPSFWGDEAASVMSAQRPLSSLFAMLGRVDAVHGTYYLFLHYWIRLFGPSELSVRLPSAIAVGCAVGGIVVLVRILADRRVAMIAGLVCAVLPRIGYMGGEARSYAMNTAVAVWLTVLLVHLLRKRMTQRRYWAAYAALLAFGVYLFLYLALLALVHGIFVLLTTRDASIRRRWIQATAVAAVLAIPIAVWGIAERHQISFLASRQSVTPSRILVTQWFGSPALAAVCWGLILIAVVAAATAWRRTRRPAPLVVLALIWLVVPSIVLLVANYAVTPAYSIRYLSFSAPAAAILVALGLTALATQLAKRRVRYAAVATAGGLAAIVGLAAPTLVSQRGPYAKDGGSDWRQASSVIDSVAHPGDAIVFDSSTRPSRDPRLAMHLYPADYAGLNDIELAEPFDQTSGLWDTTVPLTQVAKGLATTHTVWVVEYRGSADNVRGADLRELDALGFAQKSETVVHRTVIYQMSKGAS